MSELLRRMAYNKKHPGFADFVSELTAKADYAALLRAQDKISQAEYQDFEGQLYTDYLSKVPMDEYVAMRDDGRLAQIETLARTHDGTRSGYDVGKNREAVNKKITEHALDQAWLNQEINSQRYAEENVRLGRVSEDLVHRITGGDYEGAASEFYVSRHGEEPPPSDTGTYEGTNVPRIPASIASPSTAPSKE